MVQKPENCDSDSGKYRRGRENTDVDRENTEMYNLQWGNTDNV